jgi:hypothetical protein
MEVNCQLHFPAALPPGTRYVVGWAGPRVGMDVMEKREISYSFRVSNPNSSIFQLVSQLLYLLSYPNSHYVYTVT